MKLNYRYTVFLCLLLYLNFYMLACGEGSEQSSLQQQTIQAQQEALPHSPPPQSQPLSKEDREKLMRARGRSAEPLNGTQLQQKINFYPNLQLILFWNAPHPTLDSLLIDIENLPPELHDRIRIQHVITGNQMSSDVINLRIRQFGVTDPVYQILDDRKTWMANLHPDVDTVERTPAIWIYDKKNDLSLWYSSQLSEGALQAILESLSI